MSNTIWKKLDIVQQTFFLCCHYTLKQAKQHLYVVFLKEDCFADLDWIGRHSDFDISRNGKDSQFIKTDI